MKHLIAGTCLVLAGCWGEAPPLPSTEGLSTCEALRVSGDWFESYELPWWVTLFGESESEEILDEIPRALQFVLDNRATFVDDSHPLRDVQPGEVIDAIEALDGCWGRVQTREFADHSGSRVDAEAVVIDLDAGSFIAQQMKGVDGNECYSDSRPFIQVFPQQIVSSEADHLFLRIQSGEHEGLYAGVDPDGSLSLHKLAAFGYGLSEGNEYEKSFTVDGEFMITTSDDGGDFVDNVERWYRIACPE